MSIKANTRVIFTINSEDMGFEPTVPFSTHPFQGCAFDHSANLPDEKVYQISNTNQEW